MTVKLLYIDSAHYQPASLAKLGDAFDVVSDGSDDIEVAVVSLTEPFDCSKYPQLKVVVTNTTGTNHILNCPDTVEIISLKGRPEIDEISATAELTWGLLLSCVRSIPTYVSAVKSGEWNRNLNPGFMLKGKTIGLIGLGRLGKMVAGYATAFGLDVHYVDPNVSHSDYTRHDTLHDLLQVSDIVSVHVHLDDATSKLLDRKAFQSMKDGSVLINTSRGEIIDEGALLDALNSGKLHSAGVDTLAGETSFESRVDSPLAAHPKVIVTPHIGGACTDAWEMTESLVIDDLISRF